MNGRVGDSDVLSIFLLFVGDLLSDQDPVDIWNETLAAANLKSVQVVHQEPDNNTSNKEESHKEEAVLPSTVHDKATVIEHTGVNLQSFLKHTPWAVVVLEIVLATKSFVVIFWLPVTWCHSQLLHNLVCRFFVKITHV